MRNLELHEETFKLTFGAVNADVHESPFGVQYLKEHGVVLIGQTATHLKGLQQYLRGYGTEADFEQYLNDPVLLDNGSALAKFAGQVCYMSLGSKRRKNQQADEYFENLKEQKHGSVLEHPVYSLFFYGINRAFTHEAVRHRAGTAFSQQSQRYVGPEVVRYVMPRLMDRNDTGRELFFRHTRDNRQAYIERIEYAATTEPDLPGESKTDKRKRMQSFARTALANEAEAPIVISGNIRAWRHMFTMRVAPGADEGIRIPMYDAFRILRAATPIAFDDFTEKTLADGTIGITPKHLKV